MTSKVIRATLNLNMFREVDNMCAQYTVFTEDEIMEMRAIINEASKKFGEDAIVTGEVRPTNHAPILTLQSNRLSPQPVSWGFPKWDGKGVVINARCETALEKKMFSHPLLTRRCVVPSTGFFEWREEAVEEPDMQISFFPIEKKTMGKTRKEKLLFRRPGESMLYMAGMINTFTNEDGSTRDAFVILTTSPTPFMTQFHDRMPVILAADECEQWIQSDTFMREVLKREGSELEYRLAS